MPRKIAVSTLNASTIDILNVIRQNASYEYQKNVPVVERAKDVVKVGDVLYGTPALANQFINALVNRIALVRVQSATFNNPYEILKKGYIEFGETVEDIFVSIAKVVEFDPEKASAREFKRTFPDVRSAFHVMNWRVMYPVTIQDEDLKQAFLSIDGVQNLIAKIVDSVYTAANYDEFLLFKYLIIKAVSHGHMYPICVGEGTKLTDVAKKFRGTSNKLPFMSSDYNDSGVKTTTPKDRQVIFMDADFNAEFDVDVLAGAFNMDKADFMGRLFLIDNWGTFDNARFNEIRENCTGIEEVTDDELALMTGIKAIICDENWFQVYDNKSQFTENYVASGLYWNYFYHQWKTISTSPFANAVVFVTKIDEPEEITAKIVDKSVSNEATTLTLKVSTEGKTLQPNNVSFVQTEELTKDGIAVHPFGALLIPDAKASTEIQLVATINGVTYTGDPLSASALKVGQAVTMSKEPLKEV